MAKIIALTSLPTPYVLGHFIESGIPRQNIFYTKNGKKRSNWQLNFHNNRIKNIKIFNRFFHKFLQSDKVWVSSYGDFISLITAYASIFFRKRLILGPFELPYNESFYRSIIRKILLYFPLKYSERCFVCSQNAKEYFGSMTYSSENICIKRYKALALSDYKKLDSNNKLTIMFSGALTTLRNPLSVIFAIKLLDKKQISNIRLIISGSGSQLAILKKELKRIDNLEYIIDTRSETNIIHGYYAVSDVLIAPNIKSTWNMSIQEAMLHGVAIIGSNSVEAVKDLIGESGGGVIYNGDHSSQISSCIDQLIVNPKNLSKLKSKSLIYARKNFDELYVRDYDFVNLFG